MNRRKFLLGLIAGGAVVGSGGAIWLSSGSHQIPLTIDASLKTLDEMMKHDVTTSGAWSLHQVLVHCAQSVEYSMVGYPEHKSELFKSTVGPLAFKAFSKKGQMTHGLSEAIPGAPDIKKEGDLANAYLRFRKSLTDFNKYEGQLAEHFAYGELSKQEYEWAHAMHFNNHLLEIDWLS